MAKNRIESTVDSWHTPRSAQGQMVEVAYGADSDGPTYYRRTTDRADGTVTYERASMDALRGEWCPWDEHPSIAWQPA